MDQLFRSSRGKGASSLSAASHAARFCCGRRLDHLFYPDGNIGRCYHRLGRSLVDIKKAFLCLQDLILKKHIPKVRLSRTRVKLLDWSVYSPLQARFCWTPQDVFAGTMEHNNSQNSLNIFGSLMQESTAWRWNHLFRKALQTPGVNNMICNFQSSTVIHLLPLMIFARFSQTKSSSSSESWSGERFLSTPSSPPRPHLFFILCVWDTELPGSQPLCARSR